MSFVIITLQHCSLKLRAYQKIDSFEPRCHLLQLLAQMEAWQRNFLVIPVIHRASLYMLATHLLLDVQSGWALIFLSASSSARRCRQTSRQNAIHQWWETSVRRRSCQQWINALCWKRTSLPLLMNGSQPSLELQGLRTSFPAADIGLFLTFGMVMSHSNLSSQLSLLVIKLAISLWVASNFQLMLLNSLSTWAFTTLWGVARSGFVGLVLLLHLSRWLTISSTTVFFTNPEFKHL